MKQTAPARWGAGLWLLGLWAQPAAACRLALVLAMDVSSSVDGAEDALQRQGLAAALLAPTVQQAFLMPGEPVALAIYEWSGRYNQSLLQDWVTINSADDLAAVSQRISYSRRSHNDFPTALGYALGYGAGLLTKAPACDAHTIDVSGDGKNNDGFGPQEAYRAFPFADVTVNGLVINAGEYEAEVDLIEYYRDDVITGPAAFIEIANGFEDFQTTMERKLVRELGAMVIGAYDLGRGAG